MSHSVSVAAVTVGDRGRILAIRRRDNERWQLPGGVLETHEPVEHGLVREVLEETGVSVEPLCLSGVYKHVGLGIMSLVFRCKAIGMFVRQLPESLRVGWMTLDEVDEEMDRVFRLRVHDAIAQHRDGVDRLPIRHHDGREFLNSQQTLWTAGNHVVRPTEARSATQHSSPTPEVQFGHDGVVDRVSVYDEVEEPVGNVPRVGHVGVEQSSASDDHGGLSQAFAGPIELKPAIGYGSASAIGVEHLMAGGPLFPYVRERRQHERY